uniref:(northern house mosquito) hypothetical protein n=1 Tax=Culex pipiens TaxID=7175 RepID=A0A8D8MVH9_CULPI
MILARGQRLAGGGLAWLLLIAAHVGQHFGDLIPPDVADVGHVLADRLRHVGQIAQLVAAQLLRAAALLLQQQHVLGLGGTTTATATTASGTRSTGLATRFVLLAAILSLAITLIDVSKILQEAIAVVGRQNGHLVREKGLDRFLRR